MTSADSPLPTDAVTPVRLRPHHLLCMLTFVGKGYSEAFVEGYRAIVARIGAGAAVEIVEGPDDVCAPICGAAAAHCHRDSVRERDARAAESVAALFHLPIVPGTQILIDATRLSQLRDAFADGRLRAACAGCEWSPLCDGIASSGFSGALLDCRG